MDLILKYPNIEITGDIRAKQYCIIESRVHGLFACFYCILYGLYICEMEDLKPVIILGNNHLYFEEDIGDNIFNYFYTQTAPPGNVNAQIKVINPNPFLHWCYISGSEKARANLLINKYFDLKPEFERIIELYCKTHFDKKRVLGVHYRGRDKIQETQLVSFDSYIEKIDTLIEGNICDVVFFSTDEIELRQLVRERYGNKVVLYQHEGQYPVSAENKTAGLHFSTKSPFLHAKDALMECYILANSHILLSSYKSSMSLFSTFLNPDIVHAILEP